MANAMMLENPMVIGEYYDDPEPDWTCPECGMDWYHHHDLWECFERIGRREPQQGKGCIVCELEKRTAQDAVAYAQQHKGVALFQLLERIMTDYGLIAELAGDPHPMLQVFLAADPELVEQRAEEWAEEQDDDYYDWFLDNQ